MDIQEIIATIFMFAISAVTLLISIESFREKGFLINNSWIWATAVQRKKLNKKPFYRQSAIVFLLLTIVFAANGLYLLTDASFFIWIVGIATAAAVIYAVYSENNIAKAQKLTKPEDNHNA